MLESDVRAIVRLLVDPELLSLKLVDRKCLFLRKFCRLIDADHWCLSVRIASSNALTEVLSGWGSAEAGGLMVLPNWADSPQATQTSLVPGLQLQANQLSEGWASTIRLSRLPGRHPFGPRERKIAQIVLTETAWLHERVRPRGKPEVELPPRLSATLIYLSEGKSRQAIAQRLRLSRHTVDDYVKAIYRRYGVHSRAGLIKRVAEGVMDGATHPLNRGVELTGALV